MTKRVWLNIISVGFGIGCTAAIGTACLAATVEPGQGALSVNQGDGFQPVNGRVDTKVGDSVMVSPGGNATVVYSDGCKVNVQPGDVTTIGPLSPCASGSYAQDYGNPGAWVFGAVVAGVTGLAIYEIFHSNNNTTSITFSIAPVSP